MCDLDAGDLPAAPDALASTPAVSLPGGDASVPSAPDVGVAAPKVDASLPGMAMPSVPDASMPSADVLSLIHI